MSTFSAEGRLHKFGSHAGSVTEVDLISAVSLPNDPDPSTGNQTLITSFMATAGAGTSNNVFRLKVSTDGASYTTVSQIVISDGGTVLLTFRGSDKDGEGILIRKGKYFKVTFQQSVIGAVSSTLMGFTGYSDIVDTILA
jgi:hypothetical protein